MPNIEIENLIKSFSESVKLVQKVKAQMDEIQRTFRIGIPHVGRDRIGDPDTWIIQEAGNIFHFDTRIVLIELVDLIFVGQRLDIAVDLVVVDHIGNDGPHLLAGEDLRAFGSRRDTQADDDQVTDQKKRQDQEYRF